MSEETYEIILAYPRKLSAGELSALHFRRMGTADYRRAIMQTKGEQDPLWRAAEINRILACSLCVEGLTPADYDALDGADGHAVDTLVQSLWSPTSAA